MNLVNTLRYYGRGVVLPVDAIKDIDAQLQIGQFLQ